MMSGLLEVTLGVNLSRYKRMNGGLKLADEREKLRQDTLQILNKHFEAAAIEKYPKAMIRLIQEQAYHDVVDQNFNKKRISKRLSIKILYRMVEIVRSKYGPWANVTNWSKKYFRTNFEYMYRTEYGKLYGFNPGTRFENCYFTEHALRRFDERGPVVFYSNFLKAFVKEHYVTPTALDTMKFFMHLSNQYGTKEEFLYLNIGLGILVMEKFDPRVYIVKTFLIPAMLDPDIKWFEIIPDEVHSEIIKEDPDIDKVINIFENKSKPTAPSFMDEDFPYSFYIKYLPVIKRIL